MTPDTRDALLVGLVVAAIALLLALAC